MNLRRTLLPAGAATAAATLLTVGLASPASAHVTVTPDTTAAGSYAVLLFSNGHGCDGSPTTKITIQMPEEIQSVVPTRNDLYDVEKVMETLDEPITDSHGNEITERVARVVYTAKTPLPDGYRDTFELQAQLPDAAGETLAFPVVQTCEQGETGWTEIAADGQDPEELETPAPTLTITETEGDGHGHGAEETSDEGHGEDSAGESETDAAADEDSDGNGLAIAGLIAGVLGLLAGGVALARSGRKA